LHELLSDRFTERWREPRAATAAYERHNAGVRSTTYPHRLVEWRTGDGWDRVCRALNLPLPDQLFPHVNTRADCQERIAKLKARIDALIAEEASLAHRASEGVSEAPSAPDVAEWARDLGTLLRAGSAQQRKALFRLLVKELRVMSREEIRPTYKIPALVRAPEGRCGPSWTMCEPPTAP